MNATVQVGEHGFSPESLSKLEAPIPVSTDKYVSHAPRQRQSYVQGVAVGACVEIHTFAQENSIDPPEAAVEFLPDDLQDVLWELIKEVDWQSKRGKKRVKKEEKDQVVALRDYMGENLFED